MKILSLLLLLTPFQGGYQYPQLANPDVDWCSPTITMPIVACLGADEVMTQGCAEMLWPPYETDMYHLYAQLCSHADWAYEKYFLDVMSALDQLDYCCYVTPERCLGIGNLPTCFLELLPSLVKAKNDYDLEMDIGKRKLEKETMLMTLAFTSYVQVICCHGQ